eukprot:1480543-Prymnesium_polylepis.1
MGLHASTQHITCRLEGSKDVAISHRGMPDASRSEEVNETSDPLTVDGRRRLGVQELFEPHEDITQGVGDAMELEEVEVTVLQR